MHDFIILKDNSNIFLHVAKQKIAYSNKGNAQHYYNYDKKLFSAKLHVDNNNNSFFFILVYELNRWI